jgi:hypothetical protein
MTKYEGSKVVSGDNVETLLGEISHGSEIDSILNMAGKFGNKTSPDSVWNDYGKFGGSTSDFSPFCTTARFPPKIIKDGKVIGFLTSNRGIENALDLDLIKALFK